MTKRSDDRFVKLPYDVLDSAAFISASAGAKALFVFLIRRFNGRNNGQISCSVREAAAWCACGKTAAAKYFDELIALDLIEQRPLYRTWLPSECCNHLDAPAPAGPTQCGSCIA